jgi:3-methyladenine DNA glycosylase AlkD
MSFEEVMARLQELGTEQNRENYRKHGAGDDVYGVSFANLEKVRNQIGRDTDLAQLLWDSGNEDARSLATMISTPEAMSEEELDAWAESITYPVLADLFARNIVSLSPFGQSRMDAWIDSDLDLTRQVGWNLLAIQAVQEDTLPDRHFELYLGKIEQDIHEAGNWSRHAMNAALIAIGMRNARLHQVALAASQRIGRVDVDHGDSGEFTPDAATYLLQAVRRR